MQQDNVQQLRRADVLHLPEAGQRLRSLRRARNGARQGQVSSMVIFFKNLIKYTKDKLKSFTINEQESTSKNKTVV